ncbi:class I tRNA ligase family protein, partial [Vicingaceae bacterium]|nr:class I tRNA ligase family protein [Vicingaceae bacterium]
IVRDKQRRKMSKSLGNSPDPIKLIEKHGADGVRVGMLFSSPAGNDLLFDESYCEQGRNFSNKIWNAFRLIKGWEVSDTVEVDEVAEKANLWFADRFQLALKELNDHYDKFRISDALMTGYKLTWDEFCSWYLEMVKPAFGRPISRQNYNQVIHHLENIMRVLNPFMPFITEEIWQTITDRKEGDSLMVNHWPEVKKTEALVGEFELTKNLISEIRTVRKEKNISFKDKIELKVITKTPNKRFDGAVIKLTNLSSIEYVEDKVKGSVSFVLSGNEYFIPLEGAIDIQAEKVKIQEEIKYNEGFLKSVEKKLSNERFVSNAPEAVVAIERKKMAGAQEKIDLLTKQLTSL